MSNARVDCVATAVVVMVVAFLWLQDTCVLGATFQNSDAALQHL